MGVDGRGPVSHRETPKVGPSPFSLRESEGRVLPHPPPGIPTGFCHEARGCAAEALPRVKVKNINNPNGVVPNVHRVVLNVCVGRGDWTYIPGGLLFRTREHDRIPPLFVAPPGGHERHNPLRGRERDGAWTRGSASAAQPRAL